MNIDILNMKRFDKNENAIDIALPVWVVECEATPPIKNHLDAYETATLKLVNLGLSMNGIAKTLYATESLVEDILHSLEYKELVCKERSRSWEMTNRGDQFLKGNMQEKESDHSVFGLMFVNAIRKNVLPFFYDGDIGQISLFDGERLPEKLSLENNESKTFGNPGADRHRLKKAFQSYWRNKELTADVDEGIIEIEEAVTMFEGIDSPDEDYDRMDQSVDPALSSSRLCEGMFVRALNKDYHKRYLHMQIVIDPWSPGGYRIESPFDQSDIDAQYFLREMQWMSSSGDVLAGNTLLNDLLIGEIRKVIPYYGGQIKDFETFILGKLYKLYALREKRGFKNIYKDFSDIYPHITAEQSLIDMEHVVSDICRLVLEAIYNLYFEGIPKWRLREIHNEAKEELKHNSRFVVRLLCDLGIDTSKITWSQNFVFNAVGRLPYTKGNSTVEKLINIIILNYYCGRRKTKELLSNNAGRLAELTESINVIRRKVSHAKNNSHKPFSKRDYTFFMDNVIDLINRLIEPFGEEL